MEIHFAAVEDIEQLVTLRLDCFLSEKLISGESEQEILRGRSRRYFAKRLLAGDVMAVLARVGGSSRPCSSSSPNGRPLCERPGFTLLS